MKKLLPLIFFLLSVTTAQAVTRYVDANLSSDCAVGNYSIASRNCSGSDGNAYTDANSLTPVNGGSAGDITEFRAGTYTNPLIVTATGASWNNPRTIRCRTGETCTFGVSASANMRFQASVDYYTIVDRFTFSGTNLSNGSDDFAQIQIGGGTAWGNYVRIQNSNFINNATSIGISATRFSHHNEVIGNSIHGGAWLCSGCGGGGAYSYPIYLEGDNSLIQRNIFYDAPSYGIHLYSGWAETPNQNVIEFNTFHTLCTAATTCAAVTLSSGSSNVVRGNIFYNMATGSGVGAISCIDISSPGAIVYNNTCIAAKYASFSWQNSGTGFYLKNNISFNSPRDFWNRTTSSQVTAPSGATGSNNRCLNAHSFCSTTATPLFTNAGSNDYTHAAGSPMIDGGVPSIAPLPPPLLGSFTALANGSLPDIGANESIPFASGTCTTTSICDVTYGAAYAPLSTVTTCTNFTLRQATVVKTLTGCANQGNATYRLTCAACLLAGGGTIDFSVTAAKFTDSALIGGTLNQPNFAITNQVLANNISGTSEVLTVLGVRQRTYARAVTDTVGASWIKAENAVGTCRVDNCQYSGWFLVGCSGADCPPVGFQFEFDYEANFASTQTMPGTYANMTDSCVTNATCFSSTNSSAPHGTVIPDCLLTNIHGNCLAGAVAAQASSYPVLNLAQNQAAPIQLNGAIKTGLTLGGRICIRPKLDSGAAMTHNQAFCFDVVPPAGSPA